MMSGFCECMSEKLDKEAEIVVQLLDKMNFTVSTAESCTGGLISAEITSAAGASNVFELGICTYSERIKNEYLGVPMEEINAHGVVSREVALSMVRGLKKRSGADVCISVTGVAGPGGGTPQTPVGTVYIGFDICGEQFVRLLPLDGIPELNRQSIRQSAALYALSTVKQALLEAIKEQ